MPNMYKSYKEEVLPKLKEQRGYKNIMEVPRLSKIVINTGIGSDSERDAFSEAKKNISAIAGQSAVITKSRKNISNFKLRKGMAVGSMVTLRGKRMYEFLDRFVHNALPRVRDFRGISPKGFDGRGNFNMGVQDISIFTELDLDKLKYVIGLDICFVTSAKTDEEAKDLLSLMQMPFADK